MRIPKKARLSLILAFLTVTVCLAEEPIKTPVFRPDSEGFIRDWLICGPFPNDFLAGESQGFDRDYLGGEKDARPRPGQVHEALFPAVPVEFAPVIGDKNIWGYTQDKTFQNTWRIFQSPTQSIDLAKANLGLPEHIITYLVCYIDSPAERSARLKIGSDDGYKIWLNHQLLAGKDLARGAAADQESYPVTLNAGQNVLLVKLTQILGGYELYLRFTDQNDQPLTDLGIQLDGPKTRHKPQRQMPIAEQEKIYQELQQTKLKLNAAVQQSKTLSAQMKLLLEKLANLEAVNKQLNKQIEELNAHQSQTSAESAGPSTGKVVPYKARQGLREEICLNGLWEMMPNKGPEYPPAGRWVKLPIPAGLSTPANYAKYEYPSLASENILTNQDWYRFGFQVPSAWKGRKIKLYFERVNDKATFYLNGKLVGTHQGWRFPFAVDITDGVKFDSPNELLAHVAQGNAWMKGIRDDVFVKVHPSCYVSERSIVTSYRRKSITVKLWITNEDSKPHTVKITPRAVRRGKVELAMPGQEVTIAAGQTEQVELSSPWPNPKLWGIGGEYGQPNLYFLSTILEEDGKVIDEDITRFGFREFWISGYHFYLNGKRIYLQGDTFTFLKINTHTNRYFMPAWFYWQRLANINFVRAHTSIPSRLIFEAADEYGMLMESECANVGPNDDGINLLPAVERIRQVEKARLEKAIKAGRANNDAKPRPYRFSLKAIEPEDAGIKKLLSQWVVRDRNHPSIVLRSTDNERTHWQWPNEEIDKTIMYYGRYVRKLDPTRPVTHHGALGPWFAKDEDIANIHYPEFRPQYYKNWQSQYKKPLIAGEVCYPPWTKQGMSAEVVSGFADTIRSRLSSFIEADVPGIFGWLGIGGGLVRQPDGGLIGPWEKDGAIPIPWPSLSGVGTKPEVYRINRYYTHINWFDPKRPVFVPNETWKAYKETFRPMPMIKLTRLPEAIVKVTEAGGPVTGLNVFITPLEGQASHTQGVVTDPAGTAWFALKEVGRYRVYFWYKGKSYNTTILTHEAPAITRTAGFDHIQWIDFEL